MFPVLDVPIGIRAHVRRNAKTSVVVAVDAAVQIDEAVAAVPLWEFYRVMRTLEGAAWAANRRLPRELVEETKRRATLPPETRHANQAASVSLPGIRCATRLPS